MARKGETVWTLIKTTPGLPTEDDLGPRTWVRRLALRVDGKFVTKDQVLIDGKVVADWGWKLAPKTLQKNDPSKVRRVFEADGYAVE